MKSLQFEEILPYKVQDLYDLVMNIERYPEIFENIRAIQVRSCGNNAKDAIVTIDTGIMDFRYRCRVEGDPPAKVTITSNDKPFKSMKAQWSFTPQPDGQTRVRYEMQYKLGFGLLASMASRVMESQVETTRDYLRAYVARTLTPVSPAPKPPEP